jgi:hypothetical protein
VTPPVPGFDAPPVAGLPSPPVPTGTGLPEQLQGVYDEPSSAQDCVPCVPEAQAQVIDSPGTQAVAPVEEPVPSSAEPQPMAEPARISQTVEKRCMWILRALPTSRMLPRTRVRE